MKLRTGRMPRILEAYTFHPEGTVAGARPVRLPGGLIFDPLLPRARKGRRFRDLALALAEVGLRAKAGTLEGFTADEMGRMQGGIKVGRNVAAYGGPVEFNPSLTAHSAWSPEGKRAKPIHEEPGWLADPVAGSLVVAGCELLITLLEVLIERSAGSTSLVDTDAAFVQTSSDGEPRTLPGPNGRTVGTLTPEALVKILNRFGPIARSTGLSIPEQRIETTDGRSLRIRSVFKLTPEDFDADGRWAQDISCHAVSRKRYVLYRVGPSGEVISAKSSAHVIGTLANFRSDGALDTDRIEAAWRHALRSDLDGPDECGRSI